MVLGWACVRHLTQTSLPSGAAKSDSIDAKVNAGSSRVPHGSGNGQL